MRNVDHLSAAFAALASPIRRDMLTRLRHGPVTVGTLAQSYPMTRAAVSQHLTKLEKAGLVERSQRAQWVDCRLTEAGLDEAAGWLDEQRSEWSDRLDRLDEHLRGRREPSVSAATPPTQASPRATARWQATPPTS